MSKHKSPSQYVKVSNAFENNVGYLMYLLCDYQAIAVTELQ
jgi:hypothetical protein